MHRAVTPVAPARLAAWAGSLVRTRSRSWTKAREADYRWLTWLGFAAGIAFILTLSASTAFDAHAYWVADLTYQRINGDPDAFLYAPVFAQLTAPLRLLPWPAFIVVWRSIEVGAMALAAGPWTLVLLLVPQVRDELTYANINLILGLGVVAMIRRPWLWPLLSLTKITPGVSIAWFVGRRDARGLLIAILATAAIVAVSFIIDPHAWQAYIGFITTGADRSRPLSSGGQMYVDLPLRLAMSSAIALWAGFRRQPWALVVAAWFALPVLWSATFAMLAPIPRLIARRAFSSPALHQPLEP